MENMSRMNCISLPSQAQACSSDSFGFFLHESSPFQNISSYSQCSSTLAQHFSEGDMMNNNNNNKRKRRPAGTPDPDAEVVSLSPQTLMESDRYVCEICNQGFQREQNLQMHRRRHKVPWKLLKRESSTVRKRVFVCPEPSCLHHDPSHALGDLVGIKKHFRRKHSSTKQWVCHKCSKGYAVQSDYKAHLKTCGTRGHTCDCGRVFSRVESFIEHQDNCSATREDQQVSQTIRVTSNPRERDTTVDPSSSTIDAMPETTTINAHFLGESNNIELQLMPSLNNSTNESKGNEDMFTREHHYHYDSTRELGELEKDARLTELQLSLGSTMRNERDNTEEDEVMRLRVAFNEMAYADHLRKLARKQLHLAEMELKMARKMREEAELELDKAQHIRNNHVTCNACKKFLGQFQSVNNNTNNNAPSNNNLDHPSSVTVLSSEGADENDCGSMHG